MSIHLDLVGLNTLVREEIDENRNTIGAAKSRALKFVEPAGSDSPGGIVGSSFDSYTTTGGLSISFWLKAYEDNGTNQIIFIGQRADGNLSLQVEYQTSGMDSIRIFFRDPSNLTKMYSWDIGGSDTLKATELAHYVFSWDGDFTGMTPLLYINGQSVGTTDNTDTIPNTGTTRRPISKFTIGARDFATDDEAGSSISNLCFFNKKLSPTEVEEVYSNGFVQDVRLTSLNANIILYFKLGAEDILSSLSLGDEVPIGTVINSEVGNVSATVNATIFIDEFEAQPETRNKSIATLQYKDYFAALNTHRNGPYGYPMFKQLRVSDNPLTRYQNKNNIFTTTDGAPIERRTIRNDRVLSTHSDKHGELKVFDEVPVTLGNKPITSIINVSVEIDGEKFEEKLVVRSPFKNEVSYFKNDELNVIKNLRFTTSKEYEEFKKIHVVDTTDDPVTKELETIKMQQRMFPTNKYCSKNYTRARPNFVSGYWRSNRVDRTQTDQDNGFGHTIPFQSMWPLDAEQNFTTQGLAGDPGTFRIYGPSFATASTTIADAFGFHFPDIASGLDSIHLNARDVTGSIVEVGDGGFNLYFIDFAEQANSSTNAHIDVAANGSHLYYGSQAWWYYISQILLGDYFQYESVEYTITSNTRKGIYFSDLGSIKVADNHLRTMYVQNIWRNTDAPTSAPVDSAGNRENYRQHWFSCSVDCGISFWNIPYNHPEDSYDTLMFDISSSLDPAFAAFN